MRAGRRAILTVLLTLATLLPLPPEIAHAATITVSTAIDENGEGAGCSLREAIHAANYDRAFGGCPSGSGADTIVLPAGRYELSVQSRLAIISNVSVVGAGESRTIVDSSSAADNTAGFLVLAEGGIEAAFSDLTIQGGRNPLERGGAIYADRANLSLSHVTLTNNAAIDGGAVYAFGAGTERVQLINTTITGNTSRGWGGGVVAWSVTLRVVDSTIEGNAASGHGGGVATISSGTTILNSTVSRNSAAVNGGAITGARPGELNIVNSTINENSAANGGGALWYNGNLTIANSTFSGNTAPTGGSLTPSGGGTRIRNTIFDTGSSGANCETSVYPFAELVGNVADDASCFANDATNKVVADVKLGPLADNGGPTQTRALLAGSPAIDSGDDATCQAKDQRGQPRPTDGNGDGQSRCDAGAYEAPVSLTPPPPPPTACNPRPRVTTQVTRNGDGRLRATISVTNNAGSSGNAIQAIAWGPFTYANVSIVGGGAVLQGQRTTFPAGTQSVTILVGRTPGAQGANAAFTVTDACGDWRSMVGGGPGAF